jgi:hypothetical protein
MKENTAGYESGNKNKNRAGNQNHLNLNDVHGPGTWVWTGEESGNEDRAGNQNCQSLNDVHGPGLWIQTWEESGNEDRGSAGTQGGSGENVDKQKGGESLTDDPCWVDHFEDSEVMRTVHFVNVLVEAVLGLSAELSSGFFAVVKPHRSRSCHFCQL